MSSSLPINQGPDLTAPTPQNTPLQHAPITAGLSRPTVPDITESDEPEEDGPNTADLKGALAGLVHGRLAGLLGKSSGYIENLPTEVKRSLEGLKGLQVQQTALQNRYKMECLELEKKYLDLNKPLYERRLAIITGTAKPTQDEIQAGEEQSLKDDPSYEKLSTDSAETAPIPEFWLTALRNHVGTSEIITDRDAGALKHLTDIRVTYTSPKPGFKLTFIFTPNEFFENEELEKTYYYQEEVGYSGDFLYDRAIGTPIKWKEDKDLTKEFEIKKQRNKNTNRTRLVRKARPAESFFNFFAPPVPPTQEAIDSDEIDEEILDELDEKLEMDYQLGEDIKEKIIPKAVDYFTGKALEYDMMEEDDDDDDYEDIDDDDDDEALDDDSDSDGSAPPRRKGGKGGKGKGGAAANPEDCKQQ